MYRDDAGCLQIGEPGFDIIQTTRWKPLTHKTFSWGDFYDPTRWHAPRLSENDRHDIMIELKDSMNALENLKKSPYFDDDTYKGPYELLQNRYKVIKYALNGGSDSQSIPSELVFPDAPAAATKTSIDKLSVSSLTALTDGNGAIDSATGILSREIFVLGSGLDQASTVTVTAKSLDDSPDVVAPIVTAAFADTGSGGKANANFRNITLSFTLSPGQKLPRVTLCNVQVTLDPAKAASGASSSPVSAPPLLLLRKDPESTLRPLITNTIKRGADEHSLDQTISVNPAASDKEKDNGSNVLMHAEDRPGVPVPTQPTEVRIKGATK